MQYTRHSFSVALAERYGIPAAILAEEIWHWSQYNAAHGKNIHEGRVWMYQTLDGLAKAHPYLTKSAIRTAMKKLSDGNLVVKGSFNRNPYDRTTWYALTEEGISWFTSDGLELPSDSDPEEDQRENDALSGKKADRFDMLNPAHRGVELRTSMSQDRHIDVPIPADGCAESSRCNLDIFPKTLLNTNTGRTAGVGVEEAQYDFTCLDL